MSSKKKVQRTRSKRSRDTIEKFLNAAEYQFAKHGFEGASIRDMAAQAGVQLGALHYYWGSKAVLFAAVIERRQRPIADERLRRLRECGKQARAGKPNLAAVFDAYVDPPLRASIESPNATFDELTLRTITDPAPEVRRAFHAVFHTSNQLFTRLLRQCVKRIDDETFYWRLHGVMGTIVYFLTSRKLIVSLSRGRFAGHGADRGKQELIHALVAMLSAPTLKKRRRRSSRGVAVR